MIKLTFTAKVDNPNLPEKITDPIENALRNSVQTSLSLIKDRWQREAQNKLKTNRMDYLLGLNFNSTVYPLDSDGFSGSIQLVGETANKIETGRNAFDMKIGFSKSNKITKTKSGGWYLTIPFRHTTPNSNGTFGTPMPRDVYAVAKKLAANSKLSVKGGNKTSKTGYVHKSYIYDGMQRIVKSYSNSNYGQYYTFRRVSNNSDPQSWWHPGQKGVKIAESIMPFAKQTFMEVLITNFSAIF